MSNYLIRGNLGFNTFFIKNEMTNLTIITKEENLPKFTDEDYIIRWGTGRTIPNGPKIINKTKKIHETSDKGTFRKKVADAGFAMPTWLDLTAYLKEFEEFVPVIVRPLVHERSEGVYFCNSLGDVAKSVEKINGPYYISNYIKKEKEYRVFIAQGRPFIVIEKSPKDKNAVSWGCVEEGAFDYISWEDWPPSVVECAIGSFNLSGLDFAAIDIIYLDGKAYFLEANTAPEILGYYGQCFAKVLTYMIEKGRERIPVSGVDNWKMTIHPAMSDKAIIS